MCVLWACPSCFHYLNGFVIAKHSASSGWKDNLYLLRLLTLFNCKEMGRIIDFKSLKLTNSRMSASGFLLETLDLCYGCKHKQLWMYLKAWLLPHYICTHWALGFQLRRSRKSIMVPVIIWKLNKLPSSKSTGTDPINFMTVQYQCCQPGGQWEDTWFSIWLVFIILLPPRSPTFSCWHLLTIRRNLLTGGYHEMLLLWSAALIKENVVIC